MAHVHDCDQEHWISSNPATHSFENCPKAHVHPHKNWRHTHAPDGSIVGDDEPKRVPLAWRTEYLLRMPWVSPAKGAPPCDGIVWGRSSMSNRVRCKKRGKFCYRTLATSSTPTGNYCWDHLPLYASENENARYQRWIAKNPPPWKRDVTQ